MACLLIFLSAGGTIDLVYTIRPSYALLALASVVAAPHAWAGWRRLPSGLRALALGLLVVYLLATLLGEQRILPGQGRGGSHRDIAYLVDLALGLTTIGLFAGLWSDLRAVVKALAIGAILAALYGLYQWPAQHFGWPFQGAKVTLNSAGAVADRNQGAGLLGWERIRGTFVEPHFLASYLVASFPLVVAAAMATRGWLRYAMGSGALAVVIAAGLTASVPAWIIGSAGVLAALALWSLARGMVFASAALGGLLAATAAIAVLGLGAPERLASATGRSEAALSTTFEYRQRSWSAALDVWSRRPTLGYGPGQSSVRLSDELRQRAADPSAVPQVLESAQGLWAASLIDAGTVGFALWLLLLSGVLVVGGGALLRQPSLVRLVLFAATLVSIVENEIAMDRLDTRVWILMGAMLAASVPVSESPRQSVRSPFAKAAPN